MANVSTNERGMLTGLFNDMDSAERAYQGLSERGYTKDDINVVMSDDTRKTFAGSGAKTELGNKAAEGAGIGGAVGGTAGAILAAVAATGTSLALPGLGLVIAGPLAAAAAGAGAGAATGGLLGALIGWGIPEERVKRYEGGLKKGGILIGVKPRSDDDANYIERYWRDNKGQDIYRPGGVAQGAGSTVNTVVGVYDNRADAENAQQALADAGIDRGNIRMNPETETATTANETHDSGGIGGFFRSLFGSDEHREHHDVYAESVRRGSCVLTVDADSEQEADQAAQIMGRFNAIDIDERAGQWKQQGWRGYDATAPRYTTDQIQQERSSYASNTSKTPNRAANTTDQQTLQVMQEELKVGKREVQRGGVRVIQRVRETPVNESVRLRNEEVHVERHAVNKPATAADLAAFKEGTIELRETAEEAVVSKSARVVEEVVVGKEVSERTEQIKDTVRSTDVEVEQLGAARADDTDFRKHWQSTYGSTGGRYEDYDAAYRYGSTMAGNERYKNYDWNQVEPQLRSDWESNHPGSTWDKVKDAVRYGAQRMTGNRPRSR